MTTNSKIPKFRSDDYCASLKPLDKAYAVKTETPGLRLRIDKSGSKHWMLGWSEKQPCGKFKSKTMSIGAFSSENGGITYAEAVDKAINLRELIKQGVDISKIKPRDRSVNGKTVFVDDELIQSIVYDVMDGIEPIIRQSIINILTRG